MLRTTYRLHPIDVSLDEPTDPETHPCGCRGKGWEVFNDDPDAGELGEIQRCDECRIFEYDEDAQDAARFAGLLVDLDGKVLPEPTGVWSDLDRELTLLEIVRARIAQDGRRLGTKGDTTYSVLGSRVYRDFTARRLE